MSFNPDEPVGEAGEADEAHHPTEEAVVASLREENSSLKTQIEELTRRLAEYEIMDVDDDREADTGRAAAGNRRHSPVAQRGNNRNSGSSYRGRRSIPFSHRNEKQHQGRVAYLLKLLEKRSEQAWNLDLINDLQEYCASDCDFFKQALQAYGAVDAADIDLDTFITMLQSHSE